jgi:DnaJ-class molecular chaperone
MIEKQILENTNRVNKIFQTIKEFENLFPEELEKCDLKKCGHCGGTGLRDKQQTILCDFCGGIGYKGFIKIEGHFVCRACNGYGCSRCNQKGTVDWITHARGRDTLGKDKYI